MQRKLFQNRTIQKIVKVVLNIFELNEPQRIVF